MSRAKALAEAFKVMIHIVKIEANLQLQCKPTGSHWIGICEPLKLTLQADTWADLMEDFGHTLDAVMRDLLETGELEHFMRNHGWQFKAGSPPAGENAKALRFDVPFIPALMERNGPARSVRQ
jgi:hypothetical protein